MPKKNLVGGNKFNNTWMDHLSPDVVIEELPLCKKCNEVVLPAIFPSQPEGEKRRYHIAFMCLKCHLSFGEAVYTSRADHHKFCFMLDGFFRGAQNAFSKFDKDGNYTSKYLKWGAMEKEVRADLKKHEDNDKNITLRPQ